MRAILFWLCVSSVVFAAGTVPPIEQPVRHSLSPGTYALIADDHMFGAGLFDLKCSGGGLLLLEVKMFNGRELVGTHTLKGASFEYRRFCDCCEPIELIGTLRSDDRLEGEVWISEDQAVPGYFQLIRLPAEDGP